MKALKDLAIGIVCVILSCACGSQASKSASSSTASSPAASPALSPAASAPVAPVAADTTNSSLPPFQCSDQSGGGSARSDIVAVRVGSNAGYDRFVVEFNGPVPGFRVQQSSSPSVVQDPSGRTFKLQGSAALRVVLNPSSGQSTYSGPTDFTPNYPVLVEARQTGDFEAVTSWGLGLSKAACFRSFTLSSPSRLVVDVQA